LTPILGVVLLFTVLGILPGIFVLGTYVAGLTLAKALTAVIAGALLSTWFVKKETLSAAWVSLGAFMLGLVLLVPFLGWLINTLLFLLGFGVLFVGLYEQVWPLRKQKATVTEQQSTTTTTTPDQSNEEVTSTPEGENQKAE
jgi:hypothetical protein